MALMSMTGFARRDASHGDARFTWELRSVNGRGLDLRFRTPPGFDAVEVRARAMANERLARGNVSISLQIARESAGGGYRINTELLDLLVATARRYQDHPGLSPAAIDGLLAIKGVVEASETEDRDVDQKALEAALVESFAAALDDLLAARAQEGRSLADILVSQIDEIERLTGRAADLPSRTSEAIRARLREQVEMLLGRADLDEARLHQEAALLATRADIREEIDRLRAHVAQARELIASGGAIGRRLDFLAQEFNRETNTLCSKSGDTDLTRIGLSLKAVVDQFKEQLQNVE